MEKIIKLLGYQITTRLSWLGDDLLLEISGGSKAHIGSVSICRFDKGEARLEKCLLPGHRDDVIGDKFARSLAKSQKTTVCVVCGIHYDGVEPADIAQIVVEMDKVLDAIQSELNTQHSTYKNTKRQSADLTASDEEKINAYEIH